MNLYHCMIELKDDAHALAFAAAVDKWLSSLAMAGHIHGWQLFRRKFGLASGDHTDFLVLIEVESLAHLDAAFESLSESVRDDDVRSYELMHAMIRSSNVGLYRPYPDATERESVALI